MSLLIFAVISISLALVLGTLHYCSLRHHHPNAELIVEALKVIASDSAVTQKDQ